MAGAWGPFGLDGRVAIVTGGARGIGAATVTRLREAGAEVFVADLEGGDIGIDITADGAAETVVDECVARHGHVDVLVNNAGIYPLVGIDELDRATFTRVWELNVTAATFMARAAAARMTDGGSIVNVASIDGVRPMGEGFVAYGASKGALLAITRALSGELAPRRIRVNAVSPSGTLSDGVRRNLEAMPVAERDATIDMLTSRVPLGRMAEPDDIATVITFFASDASRFVTGTNLLVDGGQLRCPA